MNLVCVALDLETTGLRPESDEILEIAAVKFRGDRVLDTFQTLVNPRMAVPLRAERFTGIAQADVERAPTIEQIAGPFVAFVKDYPIVGQSANLIDLAILRRKGITLTNPVFDTFELASLLLPEVTDYKLASLAAYFGIPLESAHRALPDALATHRVFMALWRRALELDLTIISEINRLLTGVDWPLAQFFAELERVRSRNAFSTAIGAQLAAKMQLEELNLDFLLRGGKRDEALVPREEPEPIDEDLAANVLAPDGPLARTLPSFEHRPEQITMLRHVVRALNGERHLIVEAGTGTGKSLAYLVPAILFATKNQARVVVSTNTINLQDQLIGKDLPDLMNAFAKGGPTLADAAKAKIAVLKGRSNYLCLRRWNALRRSPALTLDQIKVLIRILVWLPTTTTGDRTELNLSPGELDVWNQICSTPDQCQGVGCMTNRRGLCFFQRARANAESAHVVVVNHALLLSDLANANAVLPSYDYLIIDEAHHLEDEATRQFGFEVSELDVLQWLDRLSMPAPGDRRDGLLAGLRGRLRGSAVPPPLQQEIEQLAQDLLAQAELVRRRAGELFRLLGDFVQQRSEETGEYDRRIRLTKAVREQLVWREVALAGENFALAHQSLMAGLTRLRAGLDALAGHKIIEYEQLMLELTTRIDEGSTLGQQIAATINEPSPDRVYWVAVDALTGRLTLASAPLEVAPILNEHLFSAKRSIVLTSATLSTHGNFEYVRRQWGLEDADELVVGSPFDYANAALVLVVDDLPEPNRPGYQKAVEQALVEIGRAAGGRTLALFTSRSAIRSTHAAIQPILARDAILVLGQHVDGSRKQLLEHFRTGDRTVLLGTNSFWEGVDVVGEALSVLVITKLPFAVPTDPVVAARSELLKEPFTEYALPQAVLKFKQGFGRLIRSKTDRGVVVVLDRRMHSKGYGAAFRESLPGCAIKRCLSRDLPAEIMRWLGQPPARSGDRSARVRSGRLS